MKAYRLIICYLFLFHSFFQSVAQQKEEKYIIEIDSNNVSAEEFVYLYSKNHNDSVNAFTKESLEDYLDLFINFKLKVTEAFALNYDKDPEFINEFETYRKQLAKPYLTDEKGIEDLVKASYERLKTEVKASHILIKADQKASPEDTLKAFKKALEIKNKALNGADFGMLAVQYSDDPSAKTNKGSLGYFTSLQMVHEFEDAVYNGEINDITDPIRTRFGYHIIKIQDKRPSNGSVHAAHIMIKAPDGLPREDSISAYKKAEEIYKKLQDGEDWDHLCKTFSDDRGSKDNGGELKWFSAGTMVEDFAEAAFKLQNPGDITPPVKTAFGWHIIKLLERKGIEPFEKMAPELKRKVERDARAEITQKVFLEKIKKENNFMEYPKGIKLAFQQFNDKLLEGNWETDTLNKSFETPMFSIGGQQFSAKSFLSYVMKNQAKRNNMTLLEYGEELYEKFKSESCIAFEETQLADKYPEYKNLVKEYREGLLLFKIMEEKVWNPAVKDTSGIARFFEENKENYQWDERVKAIVIDAKNKEVLDKAIVALKDSMFELDKEPTVECFYPHNKNSWGDTILNQIDEVIKKLQANPDYLVSVKAFYTKKEKKDLAEKRLIKIKAYLDAKGCDSTRVLGYENGGKLKLAVSDTLVGGRVTIKYFSKNLEILEKKMNEEDPLALKITERLFEQGESELVDDIPWEIGNHRIENDERVIQVNVLEILPPGPKQLDETRGQVISDYQNYIEKKWLENLREKYKVTVNNSTLQELIRK
ncbi:peptidylprolyl isomerase [Flexithrix dorotheae]|uniref:peptidylprolyl isomerase n=1 Tax=Flexithrix dorotheae TaxID=70993 RepID=UPI00039BA563|nr:peptidylprolyl isomerase [Flexithrix dorotheae]